MSTNVAVYSFKDSKKTVKIVYKKTTAFIWCIRKPISKRRRSTEPDA